MRQLVVMLFATIFFVFTAHAQTKSVTGVVQAYNSSWKTIDVRLSKTLPLRDYPEGTREAVVFTVGCTPKPCRYTAPKIVGDVKSIGRTVRISYSTIDVEHGFGPILRASKIEEITSNSSLSNPTFKAAEKVKTMTGTVVRDGHGGRWSFLVIRVGVINYGIQTSSEPSFGDEQSGMKPWQIKTVGNVWRAGRRVKVFYTKIDTSFDYDDITSWLKASKIVEVANR